MHCDGCCWTRKKTEAQKWQVTCPRSQSQQRWGALLSCHPWLGPSPLQAHIFCRGAGCIPALPESAGISNAGVQRASIRWKVPWECEERCYCGPGAVRPVAGNIHALPVPWEQAFRETRHAPPRILLVLAATQKVTSSWPISLSPEPPQPPSLQGLCEPSVEWRFLLLREAARARGAVGVAEGSHGGPGSCKRGSQSGGWAGEEGCVQGWRWASTRVRLPQPRTPWVVPPLPDRPPGIKTWTQPLLV